MQHKIDLNLPAKLIRGDTVNHFGDGYRQVSGPTVLEGSVSEIVEHLRELIKTDWRSYFICNESRVPLTLEELEG